MRAEILILVLCLPIVSSSAQNSEPTTLGSPAALETDPGPELIRVASGTRLRGRPSRDSSQVTTIDVEVDLPVLSEQDGWVEVRYASWRGWIRLDGDWPSGRELTRSEPSPRLLEIASRLLGISAAQQKLGPLDYLSDIEDQRLLDFLARLASSFRRGYQQRLALEVGTVATESIILFSEESDYRQFEASQQSTIDTTHFVTRGHSTDGLAVLFVGNHKRKEVAAVLVHELTHLMNRRAFPAALPPWIEEGLANEMAFSKVQDSGAVVAGSLGGRRIEVEEPVYRPGGWIGLDRKIELFGAPASLRLLAQKSRLGLRIPLTRLARMDWEEFANPHLRSSLYATSAFFVRFLLDADAELGRSFQRLLAELANGQAYLPEHLPSDLGSDWETLEREFDEWLTSYAEQASH